MRHTNTLTKPSGKLSKFYLGLNPVGSSRLTISLSTLILVPFEKSSTPSKEKTKTMIRRSTKKVRISLRVYPILIIILWNVFHFLNRRKTLKSLNPLKMVRDILSPSGSSLSY
jgi:hypothetical protein